MEKVTRYLSDDGGFYKSEKEALNADAFFAFGAQYSKLDVTISDGVITDPDDLAMFIVENSQMILELIDKTAENSTWDTVRIKDNVPKRYWYASYTETDFKVKVEREDSFEVYYEGLGLKTYTIVKDHCLGY